MDDNQRPNQEPQILTGDTEKIEKLEKELDRIEINKNKEVNTPQEAVENIPQEAHKENQEVITTQSEVVVTSASSFDVKEKITPITKPSYQVPVTGKTDALIRVGIIMMVIALVVTAVSYFAKGGTSNLSDLQVSGVSEKIQSVVGR